MIERPILYSTPMVVAMLDGRKHVTRRLNGLEEINVNPNDWLPRSRGMFIDKKGRYCYQFYRKDQRELHAFVKCPYGNVGDWLWVRENWCYWRNQSGVFYQADRIYPSLANLNAGIASADVGRPVDYDEAKLPWRPSIHLRKTHSRIWLQITDIRFERLQSIQEGDALAEGVIGVEWGPSDANGMPNYSEPFKKLWLEINGEGSWSKNPWVWVINFDVLSTTGRPALADKEAAANGTT